MRAIIACAGTGGHIIPGISIANNIMKNEPDSEIMFIGTKRGMENDLVKNSGYNIMHIESQGLSRTNPFKIIKTISKNISGYMESIKIINVFKPDVVIGTGGYICLPVFYAAIIKKIPTVMHESNAFPGKAVKMLSKKVDCTMIGFEDAASRLKNGKKVVYTGSPSNVKYEELTEIEKIAIKKNNGINNNLPVIFVTGGSLGAENISNAVLNMVKKYGVNKYNVILVTGKKKYSDICIQAKENKVDDKENFKILEFAYNMKEMYSISDMAVTRCGAMTITELREMGIPAILVPYPYAAENHQLYNAKVMEKDKIGTIILDNEINGDILYDKIEYILNNNLKLKEIGSTLRKNNKADINKEIYNQIKNCIK